MTKISSYLQNTVRNSLFELMGTTSTGYGAELICDPVGSGDRIKADDWNKVMIDLERCLIHQNGTSTNNIIAAVQGEEAKLATPARIFTTLQFLQKDIGKVHPNQLETFTHNTRRITDDVWTNTNYANTVTMLAGMGYVTTVDWSWFRENQIRYFFNLGGKMQPHIRVVGGRTIERGAWQPLISAANNVVFGRTEFLQALANPEKKFTFVISGLGDWDPKKKLGRLSVPWVKHLPPINNKTYTDTSKYAANALTVTFQLMKNHPSDTEYTKVVGSMNFVAGIGFKKKGKKTKTKDVFKKWNKKHTLVKGYFVQDTFTREIIGKYIAVRVKMETDFVTTYPNGARGGIAAQLPQTQIIAKSLSASPAPVPEFVMGINSASQTETITLRNNSTSTCTVTDIVLSSYTTGTVTPTSFSIDPSRSQDIQIQYTGSHAGHHRGYVDIVNNINSLVLFTEVNVGSTDPQYLDVTTSTYDIVSQNFKVDHAGGYFNDFGVTIEDEPGVTLTSSVTGTNDTFNIAFNGKHFTNGIYSTIATVTVNPLDSSQEPAIWHVPFTVRLNVDNRHIASWESCVLGTNTRLGISYDVIGGRAYITAGIGNDGPDMMTLRSDELTFDTWTEVYRILLDDSVAKLYSKDFCVKADSDFKYGDYFGVGTAEGSLFTIKHNNGNVDIVLNTLFNTPTQNSTEALDMSTAFRYYDSRRQYQLQSYSGLIEGNQTYVFNGFERDGSLIRSLVMPN